MEEDHSDVCVTVCVGDADTIVCVVGADAVVSL